MNKGKAGEDRACAYLKDHGYEIITRNYKTLYGELDIVARKDDILAIVEVKSRSQTSYGTPSEYVTKKKQERISRATGIYLMQNLDFHFNVRFDIIEIYWKNGKINHIPDAFMFDVGHFNI